MDAHVNVSSSPSVSGATEAASGDDGSQSGTTERLERPPRRQKQQQRSSYGSNGQVDTSGSSTDQADGVS